MIFFHDSDERDRKNILFQNWKRLNAYCISTSTDHSVRSFENIRLELQEDFKCVANLAISITHSYNSVKFEEASMLALFWKRSEVSPMECADIPRYLKCVISCNASITRVVFIS